MRIPISPTALHAHLTSCRPSRLRAILFLLSAFCILFLYLNLPSSTPTPTIPPPPADTHIILFWTPYFDNVPPHLHDSLAICPQSACHLTTDRRLTSNASAIIFHHFDLYTTQYDLPFHRSPGQYYVYFNLESPRYPKTIDLHRDPWRDFFNLTWTYRLDSDILADTYLREVRVRMGYEWMGRETARGVWGRKRMGAVVYASNCHSDSGREEYIKELGQVYPVDVFGKCGKEENRCGGPGGTECMLDVIGGYKFYLAFENSVCLDYMSEKPLLALNAGTLPIVLGRGQFSQLLPNHSYINTADFPSPAALGRYLHQLDANLTEYEAYFNWRFQPPTTWFPERLHPRNTSMCRLCEILHTPGYQSRSAARIGDWWVQDSGCERTWTWFDGIVNVGGRIVRNVLRLFV